MRSAKEDRTRLGIHCAVSFGAVLWATGGTSMMVRVGTAWGLTVNCTRDGEQSSSWRIFVGTLQRPVHECVRARLSTLVCVYIYTRLYII